MGFDLSSWSRAEREAIASWELDAGSKSFDTHVIGPDRLLDRTTVTGDAHKGVLTLLLEAYAQHERWLVGFKNQPPLNLREPKGRWVADLSLFTDEVARDQAEIVHHATDALHRLQERLESLSGNHRRDDAARRSLELVAETFTAMLPLIAWPGALPQLLVSSYVVRDGHRKALAKRQQKRDARLAPFQERATAMWLADSKLLRTTVVETLADTSEGTAEEKRLLKAWLYDNLKKPDITS